MCSNVYRLLDAAIMFHEAFELTDTVPEISKKMEMVLKGVRDTENLYICVEHSSEEDIQVVSDLFFCSFLDAYPGVDIKPKIKDNNNQKQKVGFVIVDGKYSFCVNEYEFFAH